MNEGMARTDENNASQLEDGKLNGPIKCVESAFSVDISTALLT